MVVSVVLVVKLVSFQSFCFGHFGGFTCFACFVSLFRVLVNVNNFHDIISSSWLIRKIRVILTRAFLARCFLSWKTITLYITPWLTPEENATRCVILKIHICINFRFERHESGHDT